MKITKEIRDAVLRRAGGACEYCHLPQEASVLPHQIDHIIGRQHQGSDGLDNLCLCCIRCNLKKGPNIASIDPEMDSLHLCFTLGAIPGKSISPSATTNDYVD